jgi:hypothetical protein
MNPHQIERQDPDPDPHQSDKLHLDPHKWNMSLFEHFFKVEPLFGS